MKTKKKITCLGCNKLWKNKIYDDGSYTAFYQNINTEEHFCENCIQDRPIIAVKDRPLFRNNQYLLNGKHVCSSCKWKTKTTDKLVQLSINKLWYCQDCWNWNNETNNSAVATCLRFSNDQELNCRNCGDCAICRERKAVPNTISTIALMKELWYRKDFNALTTWEDDEFNIRFQELIWELKQVRGWTAKKIQAEVNKDIFGEKKFSQRKFSRRT